MGVVHVLGVLLCIHVFQYVVNCGVIPDASEEEVFRSLCSTSCQDPAVKTSDDENPFPLFKCSCSPSCAVYGDCCYDSKYKNTTNWVKTDFICLTIVGRGQYRAISSCPADQIADFCKAAIGHQPPVTSRKTGTTYANVFCANCNGEVENLATWNVELRCSEDQQNGIVTDSVDISADYGDNIIYYLGHLWNLDLKNKTKSLCMYYVHYDDFSVIDSLELRHCENAKMISDCHVSWKDPEVMKMCRSYEDPVYFGDQLYRNYHCAKCNYMSVEHVQCIPSHIQIMQKMGLIDPETIEFCNWRGLQSCIEYLGMGKGISRPIQCLMDIDGENCGRERCPTGEKYDKRSKKCRKTVKTNKNRGI